MFIQVKLLNGFKEMLWYSIPIDWPQQNLVGTLLRVPLKNKVLPAMVVHQQQAKPKVAFALRTAIAREEFPRDTYYQNFLEQLASYYQQEPIYFFKRLRHFLQQKEITSDCINATTDVQVRQEFVLTDEQQKVTDFLIPKIRQSEYTPTVLHGVTGSGKTAVYVTLLQEAYTYGKSALLLLPEVTLALQFEQILRAQLPEHIMLISFHSGTNAQTKRLLWRRLLHSEPCVIVGVHLPILLPISNLGLIIIDEEHEVGYQEKKHPKINTKEAALLRARCTQIPILLGSATPSISSLYNVHTKNWHFFSLTKRFSGNFPVIKTVFLTNGKQRRNFWISTELQQAIADRLAKREQAIIFLNRRGYSFFVQCKECSFIAMCQSCSVSLTLHEDNRLTCHYCGYNQVMLIKCPTCSAGQDALLKKGIGTQQMVLVLQKLFPQARIGRADMDISRKKKLWAKTMHDFESGALDILVGTQTITKGYHFPRVSLVGILWADLNLHFPMYNATETTLQQLIQVAGRAGRSLAHSEVIVQAMAQHSVFDYLNEQDYLHFWQTEVEQRQVVGYPPCIRLVEIELKYVDEQIIDQEAQKLVGFLKGRIHEQNYAIIILGPAKPPVHKIKQMHMRKIYLKGMDMALMHALWQSIKHTHYKSALYFTPNPLN